MGIPSWRQIAITRSSLIVGEVGIDAVCPVAGLSHCSLYHPFSTRLQK